MRSLHLRLAAFLTTFPGLIVRAKSPDSNNTECVCCRQDKHIPKLYSSVNNMDPGSLPAELLVCSLNYHMGQTSKLHYSILHIHGYQALVLHVTCHTFIPQGLTEVEEMLIMSIYRLRPVWLQWTCGLKCSHLCFTFRTRHRCEKGGANQSHRDFRFRRSVLDRWLIPNNEYHRFNQVHIDHSALAQLPEGGNLTTVASLFLYHATSS